MSGSGSEFIEGDGGLIGVDSTSIEGYGGGNLEGCNGIEGHG